MLACLGALLIGAGAIANPLAAIYDRQELSDVLASDQEGWSANWQAFHRYFTPAELAGLAQARLQFDLTVDSQEPIAFMAGGDTIRLSVASIKFLSDLSLAQAWLQQNNYSNQTIYDYLQMLQRWQRRYGETRPPKPRAALCIPANAGDDPKVEKRWLDILNSAGNFILLHEAGHLLYRHAGNQGVAPEISRANEEAADRFALDVLSRVGDPPLGVAVLFSLFTNLLESRSDFASDAEFERATQLRTHPLSPDRLRAAANNLSTSSQAYSKAFGAAGKLAALNTSVQIMQLALLLGDPGIQDIGARAGRTAIPEDFAPRRQGRLLAWPCGAAPPNRAMPFEGVFNGQATSGGVDLNVTATLKQDGSHVAGRYSFGAGYAALEGIVSGDRLDFVWSLDGRSGRGTLTGGPAGYEGAWGEGQSAGNAGKITLQAEP